MPPTEGIRTGKAFASALPQAKAGVAHLRRVRGGNEMHRDTGSLSLIGDEGAQLGESPTVATAPLGLLPGLLVGALSDAGQVFQGDGSLRVQGIANQVLADLVVGLALKRASRPDSRAKSSRHLRRVLLVPFEAFRWSAARKRLYRSRMAVSRWPLQS